MLGDHNSKQDQEILSIVKSTPGYVPRTDIGGAPTWVYVQAYPRSEWRRLFGITVAR
jgi:hypothetical protein